jgi:hypothetical protein
MKNFTTRNSDRSWFLYLALSLALACPAMAKDLVVDGKSPAARDDNPGTLEAPLRTIQAAVDKAQPGDSVEVRGGIYHENVRVKHGGTHTSGVDWGYWADPVPKYVTIEGYKDEHVILDGSATIPAEKWERLNGCKCTYCAAFVSQAWQSMVNMVFCGEKMVMPALAKNPDKNQPDLPMLPAMPGDRAADQGFFYDKEQKKLYVNLGGRVPGKDADVAAAQLNTGVDAGGQSFVRIRKLEVRRFNQHGIVVCCGSECIVQDNYVHWCGAGINCGQTAGALVRRNIISDTMDDGITTGGVRGSIIECNVVKRFRHKPFKTRNYAGSIMCNCCFGLVLRNNVITENMTPGDGDGGPWPDCSSMGIAMYGNTCYRMSGCGFYIEAGVYGTVLRWNTVFENGSGIVFRANNANTAFENYSFNNRGSGLSIGSPDQEYPEPSADLMMFNWVINNGSGAGTGPDRHGRIAHVFDHNVYQMPSPDSVLFQYGSKQYKDLARLRAEMGQEMHGQVVAHFDPAPLGLVTFRVHGTKKHWEPVPMFGNPAVKRNDVLMNCPDLYFWRRGTFQDDCRNKWRCEGFGGMGGLAHAARQDGFLRQLYTADIGPTEVYPGAKVDKGVDDPTAARSQGVCLQVSSAPGKSITAEGLGFWSTDLPTTDGARMDLSLWIRAGKVAATAAGGGVYALAEFRDGAGQNVSRQFLAGGPDAAAPADADYVTGTYAYRKLSGTVTAPAGARWFRMGFGLKDCSGWAAFDDFDIQTRPGTPEQQVSVKSMATARAVGRIRGR